jgi:hypothetical protein
MACKVRIAAVQHFVYRHSATRSTCGEHKKTEWSTIMSTQALGRGVSTIDAGTKPGIFHRIMQSIVAGQQRKANAIVRQYLASLSDAQLTDLGYGPVEIKAIRTADTGFGTPWL